jgi:hypothetical protein
VGVDLIAVSEAHIEALCLRLRLGLAIPGEAPFRDECGGVAGRAQPFGQGHVGIARVMIVIVVQPTASVTEASHEGAPGRSADRRTRAERGKLSRGDTVGLISSLQQLRSLHRKAALRIYAAPKALCTLEVCTRRGTLAGTKQQPPQCQSRERLVG